MSNGKIRDGVLGHANPRGEKTGDESVLLPGAVTMMPVASRPARRSMRGCRARMSVSWSKTAHIVPGKPNGRRLAAQPGQEIGRRFADGGGPCGKVHGKKIAGLFDR